MGQDACRILRLRGMTLCSGLSSPPLVNQLRAQRGSETLSDHTISPPLKTHLSSRDNPANLEVLQVHITGQLVQRAQECNSTQAGLLCLGVARSQSLLCWIAHFLDPLWSSRGFRRFQQKLHTPKPNTGLCSAGVLKSQRTAAPATGSQQSPCT